MSQLKINATRAVSCALVVLAAAVGTGVGVASGQDESLPAPRSVAPALEPAIAELEVDWKGKGKIKLRAQVIPRGAKVEAVVFRYRDKRFKAKHVRQWDYARTVKARGGDGRGDKVRFKVRACTESRCVTRTGSDKAN